MTQLDADNNDVKMIRTDGGAPISKVSKKHSGSSSKEKKKKPVTPPSESEAESEAEAESESSSDEDGSSDSGSGVSFSTTDILSNDPLYFVLSKIFVTKDDVNIATLLEQIVHRLDKLCEQKSSSKKEKH
jgi:hypothetical protein